jgi:hypothetical protein
MKTDGLLKLAIALGLFLINTIFFFILTLGGAHSGIGIIGAFFFFPTYLILAAILPPSSPLNGPAINFSVVLFVTQFLIMTAIALTGLTLTKRIRGMRARSREKGNDPDQGFRQNR